MNPDEVAAVGTGLGVVLLGSWISFCVWVVKKLGSHDTALALLIQQVNPPGDKSLREILHDMQVKQAEINVHHSSNAGSE